MTKIKYVCISDTHFGEEDSLLTNLKAASTDTDPLHPSPVLVALAECLGELISECNGLDGKRPTLVLAGDILELALATTNEAAMSFERFMELFFRPKGEDAGATFDKTVYYVPGNHDHHLWELAREAQYSKYISRKGHPRFLKLPWHTTNIFSRPVPSRFLKALIEKHAGLDVRLFAAYPNLGFKDRAGKKAAIFTHGHFVEPLYYLMSLIKTNMFLDREAPQDIWDIEAENFAWIDFFWSAMGRSGQAGQDTETLYEKMGSPEALRTVFNDLARNLAAKYDLPGWGDRMETAFLKAPLHWIAGLLEKRERKEPGGPLSKAARNGLYSYVQGPLRRQLLGELQATMPLDVTLVFGHTHKPYSEDVDFEGYPRNVNVYNTGGWVVETVGPEPLHGGAVVLLDEKLNAVSLRLYNEAKAASGHVVRVEEATHAGESPSRLYEKVAGLVRPDADPWKGFSQAVASAVDVRQRHMRARVLGR